MSNADGESKSPSPKRRRVCVVSYDILGPIRNGGIGTAMTATADLLSEAGYDVTILYPSRYSEDKPISYWVRHFKDRGLCLESLFAEESGPQLSYLIYQWLKARTFDVVHFHDWRGPGYWSFRAKRQGLAFSNTVLVCQIHGQTMWHLQSSSEFISDFSQLEWDYLERASVELADEIFSPSTYMIDWMGSRGWKIPANRLVTANLLPRSFQYVSYDDHRRRVDELVFFGRLESRKGLELFCSAVDRILRLGLPIKQVTFLGKEGHVGNDSAAAYLSRVTADWSVPFAIINDRDVFGAREYLSGDGRIAIIASSVENSPYTVLECLAAAIPFVAPRVGGIAELIAISDQDFTLFEPTPGDLARALQAALQNGARLARPSVDFRENRLRWLAWHERLLAPSTDVTSVRTTDKGDSRRPQVSVCISHFGRPGFLEIAIRSIMQQTYDSIQLVLVDDASPDLESARYLESIAVDFDRRGWKIIRNPAEVWTGAARNIAVQNADGEYVLLMDDDNVARPWEVETFVTAALATGADVLTCQQQPFVGSGDPPDGEAELPIGWMPIGDDIPQAIVSNCLGDLNMFVRRSAWNELGGFTEDRYGCEDWEFLLKAVLRGYRLEVVPEILFCYRDSGTNLAHRYGARELYKSFLRPLRPALDQVPASLRSALDALVEMQHHNVRAEQRGYWRRVDEPGSVAQQIASFPLNDGRSLVALARAALDRNQERSALLLYEQALRISPANHDPILEAQLLATRDTQLDTLRSTIASWLNGDPGEHLGALLEGARLFQARGEHSTIIDLFDAHVERIPAGHELRILIGIAHYQSGNSGKVLETIYGVGASDSLAATGRADRVDRIGGDN